MPGFAGRRAGSQVSWKSSDNKVQKSILPVPLKAQNLDNIFEALLLMVQILHDLLYTILQ